MSRGIDKKKFEFLKDKTLWIWIAIVIFIVLTFDKGYIASNSMEPTLMTGKTVIYERISKLFTGINRGDIVEFKMDGKLLSKRIIGVGGDRIELRDGLVYLNGEQLDEGYLPDGTYTASYATDTYEVPEGYVFLLGDNREVSGDARLWADPYIPLKDVKGKLLIVLF